MSEARASIWSARALIGLHGAARSVVLVLKIGLFVAVIALLLDIANIDVVTDAVDNVVDRIRD